MTQANDISLSPFQNAVVNAPETIIPAQFPSLNTNDTDPAALNISLLGARGGGKTTAAVFLALSHLERYPDDASVLIVRRTYKALADFEDEFLQIAHKFFPGQFSYNRSEKIFRLGTAKLQFLALERESDYFAKVQGGNYTLLIVDEVTAYPTEKTLRLLRSNLRGPEGIPTRVVYLGNPGGPLHGRIFANHIAHRQDHIPYSIEHDDGSREFWITIRSGPADNPFIDQQAYIRRLREACHGDPVRLKQWLFGEWEQGEGLLFPMWDPNIHITDAPIAPINPDLWRTQTAADWGMSSPSVGLLGSIAKRDLNLPDGGILPAGSVIIEDEITDAILGGDDLSQSAQWSPDRLGERIGNRCLDFGVHKPNLVIDDARGLQGETVIDLVRRTGFFWSVRKPKKGRRSEGWALVASMLQAAVERSNSRPHLYINRRCNYLLQTIPNANRDERDPDDWLDTKHCPDHAGDALRYLLIESRQQPAKIGRTMGHY